MNVVRNPSIIMAKEYSNSKFYGFDNHKLSIEAAKEFTQKRGLINRFEYAVVSINESTGNDYDLITFFDCLHDMADPDGALKFAKQSMQENVTCRIIEPMANGNVENNLNLIGIIYYAVSSIICVPNSLDDNDVKLGAQDREKKIKVAEKAGFTKFILLSQPFNIVFEAKP